MSIVHTNTKISFTLKFPRKSQNFYALASASKKHYNTMNTVSVYHLLFMYHLLLTGGYSALRRLYSEVQEPMISAAQETFQPGTQEANPFAGLFPPTTQSQPAQTRPTSVPVGTESTNPLPNPWAPPTSTSQPPPTSTPTATGKWNTIIAATAFFF